MLIVTESYHVRVCVHCTVVHMQYKYQVTPIFVYKSVDMRSPSTAVRFSRES
jgi:hypothetical protein